MTLIACVVAPNYAILAADRRLTALHDGRYHVREDEECKIVCYNGYSVWAYTGPARILGRSTAEWLAITLTNFNRNSFDLAVDHVAERLSHVIMNIPLEASRMTVLTTGYMKFPNVSHLVAVAARISNFEMSDGTFCRPTSKFRTERYAFDHTENPSFIFAGQKLSRKQKNLFVRATSRPLLRRLHPSYCYRILAQEISGASKSNIQINDRVLVAGIRREVAEQAYFGSGSGLMLGEDFMYFNPTGRGGQFYGPHFATTSGITLLNFKSGSL